MNAPWPTAYDPPSTRAHKLRWIVMADVGDIRERLAENDLPDDVGHELNYYLTFLQMIAGELENIVDQLQPEGETT